MANMNNFQPPIRPTRGERIASFESLFSISLA
jgi:hypothetical protein